MPEWLTGVLILSALWISIIGTGLFVLWVILKMVKSIFFK